MTIPALLALLLLSSAATTAFADEVKRGYYWGEKPPPKEEPEKKEAPRQPLPAPPPSSEIMKMHPDDVKKLMDDYLKQAVWLQTPESVADYYKVQDAARRKAAGFTAVTSLVMLENPELNGASQYPINKPGRLAENKQVAELVQSKIQAIRDQFGLAMFSNPSCGYCDAQREILRYLRAKHGLDISEIDVTQRPDLEARFNVTVTPMVILIQRDSDRWMPVAVGVESAAGLEQSIYRAARYLLGETQPQQFLMPEHKRGGFFDPLAQVDHHDNNP